MISLNRGSRMKNKIFSMCICALFTVLIAVGAFIKIPLFIIPITFQTLFVMLAGMLLGRKLAGLSVLMYLVIGLAGIPIFAGGGGIAYVMQPTFGYLLGFLFASYIVGFLCEKTMNIYMLVFVGILGLLLIYLCGIAYFVWIQKYCYDLTYSLHYLMYSLFLPFLPQDILSCIIAAIIAKRLKQSRMIKIER